MIEPFTESQVRNKAGEALISYGTSSFGYDVRCSNEFKVFTNIHIQFLVKGNDLDSKKVEKAITLSAEKYCSASIMLGATAKITHTFKILDA